MTYPILHIPHDASTQLEQLGTKGKFWFRSENGERVLFKEGRPGTGENWSEKVCCEIAHFLGLPHAEYGLAFWNGRQGVASPSIVPKQGRLILGNELLAKVFEQDHYDPLTKYRDSQHTLRRVVAVLRNPLLMTPLDWPRPAEVSNAVGVFAGYLLLDALVSNQDRHHENWGVIGTQNGLSLASSFDHASSLGRNETDYSRVERLTTKDIGRSVEHYVTRARSGLYETQSSKQPMSTLNAFREAMKLSPEAGSYWLRQLATITPEMLNKLFGQLPHDWISPPAIDFALALLMINQKRLLELRNTL